MRYLLPYQINDFDFYFFKYQFSLFPTSRYCDTHSPYAMLYSTHNEATSYRHVKMSYKWHLFHRFHRLITVIIHHPLNLSFHPRFKIFYSCKLFRPQPFFSFTTEYTDSPDCLLILLSISVFTFSLYFPDFFVFGFVWQIKLTYVSFSAHFKIASPTVQAQ